MIKIFLLILALLFVQIYNTDPVTLTLLLKPEE